MINNLSDAQYCTVWCIETLPGGSPSSQAAIRALLQQVADHITPLLRYRGWRIKRLLESNSTKWHGLCTGNGRNDADAASVNIQMNVRRNPDIKCNELKSFAQLMGLMLHEVTHTSIGLEDIHPPEFHEQMRENRDIYNRLKSQIMSTEGGVGVGGEISEEILDNACGVKKRYKRKNVGGVKVSGGGGRIGGFGGSKKPPILSGKKMVDGRSSEAKRQKKEVAEVDVRELARRAAVERMRLQKKPSIETNNNDKDVVDLCGSSGEETVDEGVDEGVDEDEDEDEDEEEEDQIPEHKCFGDCNSCKWETEFERAVSSSSSPGGWV